MSSPPPKHSLSSPTSGNTPHPVLPTPSSSTSVSIRQYNNNKNAQLRQELEQQLAEKQKQLQESSSGIGKNVLARQVSQLRERLKEMDANTPTASIDPVDRLKSLERDLSSYSNRSHPLSPGISSIRNKDKLLNQRASTSTSTNNSLDPLPSPTTSTLLPPPTHGHDSTSLLPLPPPPTGSTPTKRRSKIPNTDRRNTDIEFATEIGQGLLLEVRKMQALLQEKEEKLRTLENQKADLERAVEAMAKQMHQREENEEKLKEETWNLELAKQELTISVTELQQNLSKANVEQNKLAKQVNDLRSEIEQLRDREEKLTNTIDNMKQRHEQDMSTIRRHAAAIQREKTDQTKQIEALTSELAIAKAQSRIGKHVSVDAEPSTRIETVDDQTASISAVKNDTSPSASPPSSPKQSPAARNQAMEVETLKTSLAHAHRMVSNLRSNLHKEKTEKFEFKKLLAESQETIEQLQNDPRMWVDAGPTRNNNSSSNVNLKLEDGLGGRRSHKASSIKQRRNNKKMGKNNKVRLNSSSQNATADNNSIYSYSSMSDEEEEDEDSEDSEYDNKKKTVGFTPLSSELSQVQKPVVVDAQVNTEPMDDFMLPTPALENNNTVARSLGDELGMAMSQKPQQEPSTLENIAGGLIAGAATTLGMESLLSKEEGVETSIQTDEEEKDLQTELEHVSSLSSAPIEYEFASQEAFSVEPEDPSIALKAAALAIAAAVAKSRQEALEAAVDTSIQSDPEDPAIIQAIIDTSVAEALIKSRQDVIANGIEASTQYEEDPAVTIAAKEAAESAITLAIANALTKSRQDAFNAGVGMSVQVEEDPSIALAAKEAAEVATALAISAAVADALTKARQDAITNGVEAFIQYEEDPAIALAAKEATEAATALAISTAVADALVKYRQDALDAAVDSSVQCEKEIIEDPSIALAAKEAAIAAGIASGIAAAVLKARQEAIESAIDSSVQCEQEDPAATEAALLAGIAKSRKEALENAIDNSVQYEEDPSVAIAVQESNDAVFASAVASALVKSRQDALDAGIDSSVQYEEDPSIAIAAKEANDAVIASAVLAGVAKSRQDAIEASIDSSVQYEEDPFIAIAAKEAAEAATLAAIAEAIAKSRKEAIDAAIDTSVQAEEDPAVALAAKQAAEAATLAAIAEAITKSRNEAIDAAIDTSVQYEEDPAIAFASKEATEAAIAAGIAAALAKAADNSVQSLSGSLNASVQHEVESTDIGVQAEQQQNGDEFVPLPPVSGHSTVSDIEDEFFDASSKPNSRRTVNGYATAPSSMKPINEENKEEVLVAGGIAALATHEIMQQSASVVSSQQKEIAAPVQELSNVAPKDEGEKMFSKAETDALIATAVALALSKAGNNKTGEIKHTDSAVASPASVHRSEQDDNGEEDDDQDYGNVVVHLPREEDTITPLPYGERPPRHNDILPVKSTVFASPQEMQVEKKIAPELTMETSLAFAQEPEIVDIPQRPTNPPPAALLNRAGLSPTFDRPMSPLLKSTKPTDLESQPSHEDLQRAALKRASIISDASASTTNTQEQLRSIDSSAVTRSNTDPNMINLITQTMIGDWLYKYIRKTVGGGLSEKKHQRYFWIHPYTRTLYWSTTAPGLDGTEAKAKSALIEDITSVTDHQNASEGLPTLSLLVQTSHRQLKLTAPTMEIHHKWFEAISHLITRNKAGNALTSLTDTIKKPHLEATTKSVSSGTSGSLLNRPSFRRLHDIFQHPTADAATHSVSTEEHLDDEYEDDDEALEDVRMCCNGKHHVSKLEKDHTHRHQYRKRKSQPVISTFG